MSTWLDKIIDIKDIGRLYGEHAGHWLLLQVLERNGNENPKRLKLISYDPDKENLRDYVLDDETWDWTKKYILVFADPEKPCTIK